MLIVQKLDDYQKKNHGLRFLRPFYLNETSEGDIDTPLYQEEHGMEIEREMSEKPHSPEKVK
jgi:hypothetical protein